MLNVYLFIMCVTLNLSIIYLEYKIIYRKYERAKTSFLIVVSCGNVDRGDKAIKKKKNIY